MGGATTPIEGLRIGKGHREDKPAIMRILAAALEFTPAEVAVAEEVLDCYLNDPSGSGYDLLVAEIASNIVGYVCYGATPLTASTWDIYWMATAPGMKGRGIGKFLLVAAEAEIKSAGGRLILIETSSQPNYESTRKFYQSQGYEIVSRIVDFYAVGDDKLTFQKRVDRGKPPAAT